MNARTGCLASLFCWKVDSDCLNWCSIVALITLVDEKQDKMARASFLYSRLA